MAKLLMIAVATALLLTPAAARELPMSPDVQAAMTLQIAGRGFNCPQAKLAFAKGEDAYGTVMQVYCGPKGQSGVYEGATFRVTARPNGQIMVEPWRP